MRAPIALLALILGCRKEQPNPTRLPSPSAVPTVSAAPKPGAKEWMVALHPGPVRMMGIAASAAGITALGNVETSALAGTATVWRLDRGGAGLQMRPIEVTDRVNGMTEGFAVATDATGNSLIATYFRGKLDIDGGPAAEETDNVILRLAPDLSVSGFASMSGSGVRLVHVGLRGESWIGVGGYKDRIKSGNSELKTGAEGLFVVDGQTLAPPRGLSREGRVLHAAHVDDKGALLIAGYPTAPEKLIVELASVDESGKLRWTRRIDGIGVHVDAIVPDGKGNTIVCGDFAATMALGSPPPASKGGEDLFVAKLDARGATQWLKTWGGSGRDSLDGCALDAEGNAYVTGAVYSGADFGNGPVDAKDEDAFVVSLDPAGALRWARTFGGSGFDIARGIAVTGVDEVYVVGQTAGLTFAGTDVAGKRAGFVAKVARP